MICSSWCCNGMHFVHGMPAMGAHLLTDCAAQVVKLSDAVQRLPRQQTQFVHGVPESFLEVGAGKAAQPAAPDGRRFGKGAYFIGKVRMPVPDLWRVSGICLIDGMVLEAVRLLVVGAEVHAPLPDRKVVATYVEEKGVFHSKCPPIHHSQTPV